MDIPHCQLPFAKLYVLPQKEKENRGMKKGKQGQNAQESLMLISTLCNGPFKQPVLVKLASSLPVSSLALLKKTMVWHLLCAVVGPSKVSVHT